MPDSDDDNASVVSDSSDDSTTTHESGGDAANETPVSDTDFRDSIRSLLQTHPAAKGEDLSSMGVHGLATLLVEHDWRYDKLRERVETVQDFMETFKASERDLEARSSSFTDTEKYWIVKGHDIATNKDLLGLQSINEVEARLVSEGKYMTALTKVIERGLETQQQDPTFAGLEDMLLGIHTISQKVKVFRGKLAKFEKLASYDSARGVVQSSFDQLLEFANSDAFKLLITKSPHTRLPTPQEEIIYLAKAYKAPTGGSSSHRHQPNARAAAGIVAYQDQVTETFSFLDDLAQVDSFDKVKEALVDAAKTYRDLHRRFDHLETSKYSDLTATQQMLEHARKGHFDKLSRWMSQAGELKSEILDLAGSKAGSTAIGAMRFVAKQQEQS